MDAESQFTLHEYKGEGVRFPWLKVIGWPKKDFFAFHVETSPRDYLKHELSKAQQLGRYLATQTTDKSVPINLLYVADGGVLLAKGMALGLEESGITSEIFAAVPNKETHSFTIPPEAIQKASASGKLVVCEDSVFHGTKLCRH